MIVSLPGSTRAPNGPYSYKNPYSKSLYLGQGALELQMNHFYKRILVQNYDIWALTDTTMNVLSGSLYLLSGACERAFGAPGCPLEAIGLQIYNFHTRSIMQNPCIFTRKHSGSKWVCKAEILYIETFLILFIKKHNSGLTARGALEAQTHQS